MIIDSYFLVKRCMTAIITCQTKELLDTWDLWTIKLQHQNSDYAYEEQEEFNKFIEHVERFIKPKKHIDRPCNKKVLYKFLVLDDIKPEIFEMMRIYRLDYQFTRT